MSKSLIFLVKSFLGNFYRNLAIFFWSHCLWRENYCLLKEVCILLYPDTFNCTYLGRLATSYYTRRLVSYSRYSSYDTCHRLMIARQRYAFASKFHQMNNLVAPYGYKFRFVIFGDGWWGPMSWRLLAVSCCWMTRQNGPSILPEDCA